MIEGRSGKVPSLQISSLASVVIPHSLSSLIEVLYLDGRGLLLHLRNSHWIVAAEIMRTFIPMCRLSQVTLHPLPPFNREESRGKYVKRNSYEELRTLRILYA